MAILGEGEEKQKIGHDVGHMVTNGGIGQGMRWLD